MSLITLASLTCILLLLGLIFDLRESDDFSRVVYEEDHHHHPEEHIVVRLFTFSFMKIYFTL